MQSRASMLPILSRPVTRPDISRPWTTVDLTAGNLDSLLTTYMHLTHGANYDDPAPWHVPAWLAQRGTR